MFVQSKKGNERLMNDIILPIEYIEKLQQKNKELQKENQSLRTRIKTIKRRRKHQTQKLNKYKLVVTDLRNALEKKNNKIDKAIEYLINPPKKIWEGHSIDEVVRILKDSDVD